jgi:hypothetical protein
LFTTIHRRSLVIPCRRGSNFQSAKAPFPQQEENKKPMKYAVHTLAVLILQAVALHASAPCQTSPVSVAISPTDSFGGSSSAAAVFPDSSAPYTNGIGGVSAIINTSCTADLILDLGKSTRRIGWSFQNAVAANSSTPPWAGTPFLSSGDHIVVRNLLYQYSPSAYYQFTTTAAFDFTAPDGGADRVTFANPSAQVYTVEPNQPYNTALVVVTHLPADSTTGAVETWVIAPSNANTNPSGTPAATELGTLLIASKHGLTNAGEFSVPFQFTVTRQ